jgi:excisionase family DNA binding protein
MIHQFQNKLNKIEKLLIASSVEKVEFLNVIEAAEFLKLKRSTLYQLTHRRKIPFYKTGKKILFKKQDLILFIENTRRAEIC